MQADLLQAYSVLIYEGSFCPHEPHPCLGSHFFQKCTVFLCTFGKNVNLKEGVVRGVSKDGSLMHRHYHEKRRALAQRLADMPLKERVGKRIPPKTPPEAPEDWPDDFPEFKAKALAHALYGIGGGGHLYGYGWINTFKNGNPRSEFPKDWTEQDIINAAMQILARQGSRSATGEYHQGTYLGIPVRVGVQDGKIKSVFPPEKGR